MHRALHAWHRSIGIAHREIEIQSLSARVLDRPCDMLNITSMHAMYAHVGANMGNMHALLSNKCNIAFFSIMQ